MAHGSRIFTPFNMCKHLASAPQDASHARSGATSGNAPPVRPLAGAEGASRSRESPARGEAVEREDRRLGTHPLQKQQSQIVT